MDVAIATSIRSAEVLRGICYACDDGWSTNSRGPAPRCGIWKVMRMKAATDRASAWPPSRLIGVLTIGRLRLWTGLIIFAYCVMHFVNHAGGVFLVDAMDAARLWIMPVWQGLLGQSLLYGALIVHAGLSLWTLYRRRHLRMPPGEAVQLSLGLLIPVLILEHVVSTRIAESFLGLEGSYERLMIRYWIEEPWRGGQLVLLLIIVWGHACVGLHYWLRRHRWYQSRIVVAVVAAVLLPVLALAGFVASGVSLANKLRADRGYAAEVSGIGGSADQAAILQATETWLLAGYLAILGAVVGARAWREWRDRRANPVRIRYLGGRDVVVPRGFTILEASRFAGVAHRSVCGGRGRCSTCRVRIIDGAARLPDADTVERETLGRIKAQPDIRLACCLKPSGDVTVQPIVPARADRRREPELESLDTGREIDIAALFIDMRRSTELTVSKLPYDALFIVDRYLETVLHAVRDRDGQAVSIAGDGVMAIFGLHGDVRRACRQAVDAAHGIWGGIDSLNAELADDLPWPLRFGIGIHAGISVVGISRANWQASVQFLGDTGNVASRLERLSKEAGRPVVLSRRVADLAALAVAPDDLRRVALDGRQSEIDVVLVERRNHLVPGPMAGAA